MSLLVSGSLAYDYIMNFPDAFKNHIMPDQIHILNVCFVVDKLQKSWGGTGGSIAYNAKLLGDNPILVSALGQDGQEYLDYFKKLNISTDYIARDPKRLTASPISPPITKISKLPLFTAARWIWLRPSNCRLTLPALE